MAFSANGRETSRNIPPYVSFDALEAFLRICARSPRIDRIDRAILDRFTPSVRAQLRPALRALGLIDTAGKPSNLLKQLAASVGTGDYPSRLADMLDKAYPDAAALDLATASPSELGDAISNPGCSSSVLKRAMRFYLSASIAADRPVGPRLQFGRRARPSTAGIPGSLPSQRRHAGEQRTTIDQMLDKLPSFDPNWAAETQEIWLRCFDRGLRAIMRRR